jgi:hypothetical protein
MTPERSAPGSGSPERAYQPPQRRGGETMTEPMRTARQAAQHMIDELEAIAARLAAEPDKSPQDCERSDYEPGYRDVLAGRGGADEGVEDLVVAEHRGNRVGLAAVEGDRSGQVKQPADHHEQPRRGSGV